MAKTATYALITSQTLGSATSTLTLDSIPATYTDLKLVISATASSTAHHIFFRLNSDSSSNYSWTNVGGDGSTPGSSRLSTQPEGRLTYAAAVRTGAPTQVEANFMDYANTTTYKTVISRNGRASDGVEATVNLWRKTPEAINSIYLFTTGPSFAAGSTFELYGIEAGNAA